MKNQTTTERAPDRSSLPQQVVVSKFGGDTIIEQDAQGLARDIQIVMREEYEARKQHSCPYSYRYKALEIAKELIDVHK
tara:strand:+ start:712 stop:948 length:237 start_codon:yes stop_codon:yes gene_type:complete